MMSLLQRINSSAYLCDLLARHPDLKLYASGQQRVDEAILRVQIDSLEPCNDTDSAAIEDTQASSERLREAKQRFSLLWSIADLSAALEYTMLGQLQSLFAEMSIQRALEISWRSAQISRLFINPERVPASESGIFILALGKLGGFDLNFSSDVDLIAFYSKSLLKVAPMHGEGHAVSECLKVVGKVLSDATETGFVWRVDWRLRPHASLRSLSMLADKALYFYHYRARPWHRLAMIKARPVAGNIALAKGFLADLGPFLWRHNLDYRAVDDIALLKTRINLEHPALVGQRMRDSPMLAQGRGMNLKLGHGGIREIEFIVNAKQLLWGGRKSALRLTNTLAAIDALVEANLLEATQAKSLSRAYRFLRQAENRLQMQDNRQIYHLPVDDQALQAYLKMWGDLDWVTFNARLQHHREQVHGQFDALFHDGSSASDKTDWPFEKNAGSLNQAAKDIVRDWQQGFAAYGLAPGQAARFGPLLGALAEQVDISRCPRNDAIVQIDDYFKRLPPGGQYLRLLRDFPWLLEKLVLPVLLSPAMTALLQQSPHIIDRFLEQQPGPEVELDTTIVFSSRDYEYRLENLRRLANEELYLRYSSYFEQKISACVFQSRLTRLAEQLLCAAIKVACDEMRLESAPIAVIAFGKLGTQGMMPKSDLDLVYLCDSIAEHALASQFASRLNTIINSPMREGRVYQLDTRLRPSGHSGSVTISLNSYRQHQLERAHTWPHLALVPARFVAGNKNIGAQFPAIKADILSRPRDPLQFKYDCAKMLKRVREQRIVEAEEDQFAAKLRPAGLFELEYVLSCLAIDACAGNSQRAKLPYQALLAQLAAINGAECLPAIETLHTLQLEIRLLGHDGKRFSELPEPVLNHVLKALDCESIPAMVAKINLALKVSRELIERFFEGIDWDSLPAWKDSKVRWL